MRWWTARKGNVFINYRREDSAAWAGRIHDRLVRSLPTRRIFIDVDNIPEGEPFAELLDQKVAQCDVFLAVIGPDWLDVHDQSGNRRIDNSADFVRIEIASALKRKNILVIPVVVGGAKMPSANELPDDIRELAGRNALEIHSNRFHQDADRLLKRVRSALPFYVRRRRAIRYALTSLTLFSVAAAFYTAVFTSKLDTAFGLERFIRPSAIEWETLTYQDKTNPAYLRDFIDRQTATPEGREAAYWLNFISERAWSKIEDTADTNKIADFLATFRNSDQAKLASSRQEQLHANAEGRSGQTDLSPLARFRDCAECPEMIVIPPGQFTMGSLDSEKFQLQDDDESPRQPITIAKRFAVGRFEVTLGEFKVFVNQTGRSMGDECIGIFDPVQRPGSWGEIPQRNFINAGFVQGDDHPAVCVSWDDATAYARWLSKRTGAEYRLPTEAEWEYAARAGSQESYSFGDDESLLCQFGNGADRSLNAAWDANRWCADGKPFGSAAVGSYKPNLFGLRDSHGNVHEWVADCYHNSYADMPDETKKAGAAWVSPSCIARVIRGGCWAYPAVGLRSASREPWEQFKRSYCVGFRIARTLEER